MLSRYGTARTISSGSDQSVQRFDKLLAHVRTKAPHPWIYPLFCFAAHTGARRSEILRALVADVDFTRLDADPAGVRANRLFLELPGYREATRPAAGEAAW